MDQEFTNVYKKLNAEQKRAVDSLDGPLLVVAGPGTGKTQLLSTRVANILYKTDTDPSNILCLTFTNFAALNMQDRLQSLIGSRAHKVAIRTFHSFAADIMNMYPDYFWNGANLRIVPDTIQMEILQNILGKLPLDNPLALKFAGNFTSINDVQQALRLTKEAALTPDKLQAMIDVNSAYIDIIEPILVKLLEPTLSIKRLPQLLESVNNLPDQNIDESVLPLVSLSTVIKESLKNAIATDEINGKTTETGKWKRRWIQTIQGEKGMFDERRRNAWWLALVEAYELYRDQLHEQGYYDYSDMIIEVITQLEQHPDLLAQVQSSYQYILIDEFQDTNAAQLRLSYLVANHPMSEGKPNIMVVGDDDQSIFAFNGAELNNMLRFRQTYASTKTIVLTKNYRSNQNVLDTAESIITQADDRLVHRSPDLNKKLTAESPTKAGAIHHNQYPTKEHQLYAVAESIGKHWHDSPENSLAVLARNHDSLRQLSAYLSERAIPIRYEQQNNILEQPLIIQIVIIAEIIAAIQIGDTKKTNYNIAKLLAFDAWGIAPIELWKLAIENSRNGDWLTALHASKAKQLRALSEWFLWLAKTASHEPLGILFEYIIGLRDGPGFTSPLHNSYIEKRDIDSEYLDALSGIRTIQSVIVDMTSATNQNPSIQDFLKFIHISETLSKPLTDESWFVSGTKAVNLLTIHKAKGLEFDTVFLIDAIDTNWQPKRRGRRPPANLPLQPYGELFDDYVRLAYVAATRARESFIVSSYEFDTQGRKLLPTPLIESLPTLDSGITESSDSIPVLESAIRWPRLNSRDEQALLSARLTDYTLNATAFLQYLDVKSGGPLHFLQTQLLRLPQVTTTSMAFGTAIHKALQTGQLLANSDSFTIQSALEVYISALHNQLLPEAEVERYEKHGEAVLTKLFGDLGFQFVKGDIPELTIQHAQLGKARLSGTLDHVALDKNVVQVSDYKTAIPLESFDTKDQLKAIKAWRHKNQLLFYTHLYRQSTQYKKTSMVKTQMIYVEAENQKQLYLSYEPDPEALQRTEKLIQAVWRNIMSLSFPDTDSYPQTIAGIHAFEEDLLK